MIAKSKATSQRMWCVLILDLKALASMVCQVGAQRLTRVMLIAPELVVGANLQLFCRICTRKLPAQAAMGKRPKGELEPVRDNKLKLPKECKRCLSSRQVRGERRKKHGYRLPTGMNRTREPAIISKLRSKTARTIGMLAWAPREVGQGRQPSPLFSSHSHSSGRVGIQKAEGPTQRPHPCGTPDVNRYRPSIGPMQSVFCFRYWVAILALTLCACLARRGVSAVKVGRKRTPFSFPARAIRETVH